MVFSSDDEYVHDDNNFIFDEHAWYDIPQPQPKRPKLFSDDEDDGDTESTRAAVHAVKEKYPEEFELIRDDRPSLPGIELLCTYLAHPLWLATTLANLEVADSGIVTREHMRYNYASPQLVLAGSLKLAECFQRGVVANNVVMRHLVYPAEFAATLGFFVDILRHPAERDLSFYRNGVPANERIASDELKKRVKDTLGDVIFESVPEEFWILYPIFYGMIGGDRTSAALLYGETAEEFALGFLTDIYTPATGRTLMSATESLDLDDAIDVFTRPTLPSTPGLVFSTFQGSVKNNLPVARLLTLSRCIEDFYSQSPELTLIRLNMMGFGAGAGADDLTVWANVFCLKCADANPLGISRIYLPPSPIITQIPNIVDLAETQRYERSYVEALNGHFENRVALTKQYIRLGYWFGATSALYRTTVRTFFKNLVPDHHTQFRTPMYPFASTTYNQKMTKHNIVSYIDLIEAKDSAAVYTQLAGELEIDGAFNTNFHAPFSTRLEDVISRQEGTAVSLSEALDWLDLNRKLQLVDIQTSNNIVHGLIAEFRRPEAAIGCVVMSTVFYPSDVPAVDEQVTPTLSAFVTLASTTVMLWNRRAHVVFDRETVTQVDAKSIVTDAVGRSLQDIKSFAPIVNVHDAVEKQSFTADIPQAPEIPVNLARVLARDAPDDIIELAKNNNMMGTFVPLLRRYLATWTQRRLATCQGVNNGDPVPELHDHTGVYVAKLGKPLDVVFVEVGDSLESFLWSNLKPSSVVTGVNAAVDAIRTEQRFYAPDNLPYRRIEAAILQRAKANPSNWTYSVPLPWIGTVAPSNERTIPIAVTASAYIHERETDAKPAYVPGFANLLVSPAEEVIQPRLELTDSFDPDFDPGAIFDLGEYVGGDEPNPLNDLDLSGADVPDTNAHTEHDLPGGEDVVDMHGVTTVADPGVSDIARLDRGTDGTVKFPTHNKHSKINYVRLFDYRLDRHLCKHTFGISGFNASIIEHMGKAKNSYRPNIHQKNTADEQRGEFIYLSEDFMVSPSFPREYQAGFSQQALAAHSISVLNILSSIGPNAKNEQFRTGNERSWWDAVDFCMTRLMPTHVGVINPKHETVLENWPNHVLSPEEPVDYLWPEYFKIGHSTFNVHFLNTPTSFVRAAIKFVDATLDATAEEVLLHRDAALRVLLGASENRLLSDDALLDLAVQSINNGCAPLFHPSNTVQGRAGTIATTALIHRNSLRQQGRSVKQELLDACTFIELFIGHELELWERVTKTGALLHAAYVPYSKERLPRMLRAINEAVKGGPGRATTVQFVRETIVDVFGMTGDPNEVYIPIIDAPDIFEYVMTAVVPFIVHAMATPSQHLYYWAFEELISPTPDMTDKERQRVIGQRMYDCKWEVATAREIRSSHTYFTYKQVRSLRRIDPSPRCLGEHDTAVSMIPNTLWTPSARHLASGLERDDMKKVVESFAVMTTGNENPTVKMCEAMESRDHDTSLFGPRESGQSAKAYFPPGPASGSVLVDDVPPNRRTVPSLYSSRPLGPHAVDDGASYLVPEGVVAGLRINSELEGIVSNLISLPLMLSDYSLRLLRPATNKLRSSDRTVWLSIALTRQVASVYSDLDTGEVYREHWHRKVVPFGLGTDVQQISLKTNKWKKPLTSDADSGFIQKRVESSDHFHFVPSDVYYGPRRFLESRQFQDMIGRSQTPRPTKLTIDDHTEQPVITIMYKDTEHVPEVHVNAQLLGDPDERNLASAFKTPLRQLNTKDVYDEFVRAMDNTVRLEHSALRVQFKVSDDTIADARFVSVGVDEFIPGAGTRRGAAKVCLSNSRMHEYIETEITAAYQSVGQTRPGLPERSALLYNYKDTNSPLVPGRVHAEGAPGHTIHVTGAFHDNYNLPVAFLLHGYAKWTALNAQYHANAYDMTGAALGVDDAGRFINRQGQWRRLTPLIFDYAHQVWSRKTQGAINAVTRRLTGLDIVSLVYRNQTEDIADDDIVMYDTEEDEEEEV